MDPFSLCLNFIIYGNLRYEKILNDMQIQSIQNVAMKLVRNYVNLKNWYFQSLILLGQLSPQLCVCNLLDEKLDDVLAYY